jgi:PAS domain S-box-containing protein
MKLSVMSDKSNFRQQIDDLYARVAALKYSPDESSTTRDLLDDLLNDLMTALEELDVAEDEVREQNETLESTRDALAYERQRYQQLFDFAPDAYIVTDLNGTIRQANQAAEMMLNLEQKFLISKPLSVFVVEDQRSWFRSIVGHLQKTGEPQSHQLMLLPRKREIPITVMALSNLVYDMESMPSAISWALVDITERTQLERELRSLNMELEARVQERTAKLEAASREKDQLILSEQDARSASERANALKTKLLAMISHELRTPLTSIKGFASTLLAQDVEWDKARWREFVEIIEEESDRLTELVEQLLELSRLQAGALRITQELHSLIEVVQMAMPQLQTLTSERLLKIDVPTDLPLLYVDRRRMAQVVVNLVNNAMKYSSTGTPITLTARAQNDEIEVRISDQGIGIPIEEREQVFEAFYQREDHLIRRTGAGLGLAICKGLVEEHNGRIWIADQEIPGTTVCFTLPVAQL